MSMIVPVQSRCHEGSPVGKRSLRWEGFFFVYNGKRRRKCSNMAHLHAVTLCL